jgi:hypothetical protein
MLGESTKMIADEIKLVDGDVFAYSRKELVRCLWSEEWAKNEAREKSKRT